MNVDMQVIADLARISQCSYKERDDYEVPHNREVFFFENESRNVKAVMEIDRGDQLIIIGFRGTRSFKDVITDIDIRLKEIKGERRFLSVPKVHSGYYSSFLSIKDMLFEKIANLVEEGKFKVYLTGHSSGGGIAIICAYMLAKTFPIPVIVRTFGAPDIGNNHFASSYNALIKDSYNVILDQDIIGNISLPRAEPVGGKIFVDDDGQFLGLPTTESLHTRSKRTKFINLVSKDTLKDHSIAEYVRLITLDEGGDGL